MPSPSRFRPWITGCKRGIQTGYPCGFISWNPLSHGVGAPVPIQAMVFELDTVETFLAFESTGNGSSSKVSSSKWSGFKSLTRLAFSSKENTRAPAFQDASGLPDNLITKRIYTPRSQGLILQPFRHAGKLPIPNPLHHSPFERQSRRLTEPSNSSRGMRLPAAPSPPSTAVDCVR